MAEVKSAKMQASQPMTLKGPAAVASVLAASFTDEDLTVDGSDPISLAAGTEVEVYPIDSGGFTHRDRGRLVKLRKNEVAISIEAPTSEEVRVHAPRWKFRIQRPKPPKL